MRSLRLALLLVLVVLFPTCAMAAPLLLISVDGLRPGDVLDADKRGLKIPTLRRFVAQGAWAEAVTGVLPTLTYPSHTTLITGVAPARHGIANNLTFDPEGINQSGWYWYASDIRMPTLWDAAKRAGLVTANVHWPVSVGAAAIDHNLPQIWRTGHDDDRKLMRVLASAGLLERLEAELGPYAQGIDESVAGDAVRTRFAVRMIGDYRPGFITVYLTGLDHIQHQFGPDTPEAHAALEAIDAMVARLVDAAIAADPATAVALVSDHGFAHVSQDVNLTGAFAEAGLVRIEGGKVTSWEAIPWFAGGSAAVVLARPDDPALKAKVAALLASLAARPELHIATIYDRAAIAAREGAPTADFWICFGPGTEMGRDLTAPLVAPSTLKGMHGYDPARPEMRSTLLLMGRGLPYRGNLGTIDMRRIAPTLALLMGTSLPTAELPAIGR
jgi:predicted AlkP superfamily pyrophosphatase or phosphodiesterase